jgi:transcriptional regulator with XRE-family HTH domain
MSKETLSQYVRFIIKQKGLNLRDIERNSGKEISNSYLSKIINEKVRSLTAEKIVALAKGLDVNPHDVFTAVCGQPPDSEGRQVSFDALLLVDIIQKITMDPQLMEVLQEWLQMRPKEKAVMLETLKFLNDRSGEARQKDKKRG